MIATPQTTPGAAPRSIRLVQLGAGESARLQTTDLEQEDCELLRALGMTDSCILRVCKAGDPCIVQVRSTRIGLSHRLAEHILVVPSQPAP
ncbi:MAG: FeoA family protein [Acidobacteriota bacterium]